MQGSTTPTSPSCSRANGAIVPKDEAISPAVSQLADIVAASAADVGSDDVIIVNVEGSVGGDVNNNDNED